MRVVSHFVSHWLTAVRKGRGVSRLDGLALGLVGDSVYSGNAGLLWGGEGSRVGGMSPTEKLTPSKLVVGGRYLNRNGLFIREIEAIEGHRVHYHDQYSSWSCFDSSFVQACPTVATPEDEERVKMEALAQGASRWQAKLARDSSLRLA